MSNIIEIMTFLCVTMNGIFQSFDSVYIDEGLSILDIFVGFMYLEITLWFIFTLISYKKTASSIKE